MPTQQKHNRRPEKKNDNNKTNGGVEIVTLNDRAGRRLTATNEGEKERRGRCRDDFRM